MPGGRWAWRQGDGGKLAKMPVGLETRLPGCQGARIQGGEEARRRGGEDDKRPGLVTVNEDMRFCPFQIETEREGK